MQLYHQNKLDMAQTYSHSILLRQKPASVLVISDPYQDSLTNIAGRVFVLFGSSTYEANSFSSTSKQLGLLTMITALLQL
ncbi:MAG: hypothetical protein IRD7MM_03650 [Candidatus Midichloria mitochondrii]